MTIRIDDELVITGDMRNPAACIRLVFPACSGLSQAPIALRRQAISIFRGDDLQVTFSMLDELGLPVSIDKSQRLEFWVGKTNKGPVVLTKRRQFGELLFSGGLVLLGDDFRCRMQIDSVDTKDLEPGTYYWEFRLFTNNLKFVTTGFGPFTIVRDLINDANEPI